MNLDFYFINTCDTYAWFFKKILNTLIKLTEHVKNIRLKLLCVVYLLYLS